MGIATVVGGDVGRRILPHLRRTVCVRLVLGMLILFGRKLLLW
jgi:hypothetical protein